MDLAIIFIGFLIAELQLLPGILIDNMLVGSIHVLLLRFRIL